MTMILALSSFPKISISSYNHNAVLLDFENTRETKGYTNRKYLKNKAIFRLLQWKNTYMMNMTYASNSTW